jgi:23S rRNA (adenine2503-C2)-methyltransferase
MTRTTSPLHTVADLRAALEALGARPTHIRRLLTGWLAGRGHEEIPRRRRRTPRRSATLEAGLGEVFDALESLVDEIHHSEGPDGSCRRLLRLESGRTIESVDLPQEGLCVSTQVGCAVGCTFCKTGENGLLQQLSSLEVLAQLAHARRSRTVRKVVLMGMGEPAHNLEAVVEAVDAMGDEGGIAHKSVIFSTVGDPAIFEQLSKRRVRPSLALSLHSLDDGTRANLLQRAPRIEPRVLLDAAMAYADRVSSALLVQWTLLEGINDTTAEASELAAILRGRRAIINYIPFNDVEGNGFRRPPVERCVELVRTVRAHGALATLRFSAGQEIEGGCGQLRARVGETRSS